MLAGRNVWLQHCSSLHHRGMDMTQVPNLKALDALDRWCKKQSPFPSAIVPAAGCHRVPVSTRNRTPPEESSKPRR